MPRKSSPVATAKDFFSCGGDDRAEVWCCGGIALVEKAMVLSGTVAVDWGKTAEGVAIIVDGEKAKEVAILATDGFFI